MYARQTHLRIKKKHQKQLTTTTTTMATTTTTTNLAIFVPQQCQLDPFIAAITMKVLPQLRGKTLRELSDKNSSKTVLQGLEDKVVEVIS